MGIEEIDIAINITSLIAVQNTVDAGLLVMDKVKQAISAGGQMHVNNIAAIDIKDGE